MSSGNYIDNSPFMDRYHRITRNILCAMQDVVGTFGALLSAMLKTSAVVALLSWTNPWLLALLLITVLLDIAMMMVTGRYHYEFTVKNLFSVLPRIYTAGLHGHDYFELMEDDSIRTSTNRSGRKLESIDSVEFDNVSFRYLGSDQDALSNISLSIRKGERVAIVGTNGVGKTALVKVLMGLYTPTSGRVD